MKLIKYFSIFILAVLSTSNAFSQKKQNKLTDANASLHLLQPEYNIPYEISTQVSVKKTLDKILAFIDKSTPTKVIDKSTGKQITDFSTLHPDAQLEKGSFRLTSYEWGVCYSGLFEVAKATGDTAYMKYVTDRFNFLSSVAPYFKKMIYDNGVIDPQMQQMLSPQALDDAGAMCCAMIKAQEKNDSLKLRPIIDHYINYMLYSSYRLSDGTFARNRPQRNSLWLDDLYMSVPALAQMGRLTSEEKYYNEATRQIKQFASRMFVKEKGLFMHGWVEGMKDHPAFFWGRANGWALLAMTEVLDVLPKNHPDREYILSLLQSQIKALASYQSRDGFWHQLIDKNDSYPETSSTAIFVYCIAKAIDNGWMDAEAYGPVAQLGWNAVSSKVNAEGQVEGTCVGTGMAFDPAYYYYRPTSIYAAHGYGTVLLAGAEMTNLLKNQHPKINDSSIQFYDKEHTTSAPIFEVNDSSRPEDIQAGSTRKKPNSPVVFLIGDSTVKNGRGKGDNGQWGWGSFFEQFFDSTRITVENHALGGRSSRTFSTEGLWNKVLPGIQKGDYLFIQFGHNDGGPLNTGRARASLKGTGEESETVIMEQNGGPEEVFTFGHYIRMYIRQAKAKGAIPIVLSPTPNNRWTDGKIFRLTETYTAWAKEVAKQENVIFIDLNDISADKFDKMGEQTGKSLYKDSVHTTHDGAILNGESVVEGIRSIPGFSLTSYLKK